ncbi:phage tail protein [Parasphingorhabdus sp.]|uniref:GTA baseplate fiber-binding domain-containing protein n=1 Tax=Parasphingorhabdus sp. TaxID=2709688 RepID=UPI0032663604
MATLVLTAVGSAIGGPIGGALGAVLGQTLDQNLLFKPAGREGPRIQDLTVQTSSYGSQIPRIYGRMRVAGTVIWATDIKETKQTESSGKGKPGSTTYAYSACFAVALSSRPIYSVGRIWADGKIFRGSAGDFKTPTGFQIHTGQEDQLADDLIEAAEADGASPAFRGLAVAVFEDMDLADYGNRIPSLTFEVIADDQDVIVADILADLSNDSISSDINRTLSGFAGAGPDRRAAILPLMRAMPMSFQDVGTGHHALHQLEEELAKTIFEEQHIAHQTDGQDLSRPEMQSRSEAQVPRQLALRYYDPDRDYQTSLQNAFRSGKSRMVKHLDFPAVLPAADARSLADTGLWAAYQNRVSASAHIVPVSNFAKPGSLVVLPNWPDTWRVRGWEFKGGAIELALSRFGGRLPDQENSADQGRAVQEPDALAGPTRAALVDLPFALESPEQISDSPRLFAVAAGETGWRNAQLYTVDDEGESSQWIAPVPSPALLGTCEDILAGASPLLVDEVSKLDIVLHNPEMNLHDASDAQLLAGQNLASIGAEIIQFGSALPLGNNRYRISRLLRGLGGTEIEIERHEADEDFILLESGSLVEIGSRFYSIFQPVSIAVVGRDDDEPVIASLAYSGRALKPWSPVHPSRSFGSTGDLTLGWTRRSRAGLLWLDGVDAPRAEDDERYRISIWLDEGSQLVAVEEVSAPQFEISAADVTQYISSGTISLTFEVSQIGRYGWSDPLIISVSLA